MALALLADVQEDVIAMLNANPGVWSSSVSGTVGAFPSDDEIEQRIFEADALVATQGYFQSVNDSLANPFFVVSDDLAYGDDYPQHHGKINKVEVSDDSTTWIVGVKANSLDDITTALAVGEAYVGSGAFDFLYFLDNGQFYSTQTYGRVTYPAYVQTSLLQCNQNEQSLIALGACKLLTKNASPSMFAEYTQQFDAGISQLVQDGSYTPAEIP